MEPIKSETSKIYTATAPVYLNPELPKLDEPLPMIVPKKCHELRQNGFVLLTDRYGGDHPCKIVAMTPSRA